MICGVQCMVTRWGLDSPSQTCVRLSHTTEMTNVQSAEPVLPQIPIASVLRPSPDSCPANIKPTQQFVTRPDLHRCTPNTFPPHLRDPYFLHALSLRHNCLTQSRPQTKSANRNSQNLSARRRSLPSTSDLQRRHRSHQFPLHPQNSHRPTLNPHSQPNPEPRFQTRSSKSSVPCRSPTDTALTRRKFTNPHTNHPEPPFPFAHDTPPFPQSQHQPSIHTQPKHPNKQPHQNAHPPTPPPFPPPGGPPPTPHLRRHVPLDPRRRRRRPPAPTQNDARAQSLRQRRLRHPAKHMHSRTRAEFRRVLWSAGRLHRYCQRRGGDAVADGDHGEYCDDFGQTRAAWDAGTGLGSRGEAGDAAEVAASYCAGWWGGEGEEEGECCRGGGEEEEGGVGAWEGEGGGFAGWGGGGG